MPSEIADPRATWDDFTRYQFDNAVTVFGLTLENALTETDEVTTYVQGKKQTSHKAKYKIAQLLDPDFRLPRPKPELPAPQPAPGGFAALVAMARQKGSGVKLYEYVKPS